MERIFSLIAGHEGSRHDLTHGDRGNWTGGRVGVGELRGSRFGVSAASYPTVDIAALTLAQAQEIFRRDFWTPLRAGEMPAPVAFVVADAAWNSGVPRAAAWLQRAVGAHADGIVGPRTLNAAGARLRRDGTSGVVGEFLAWRLAFMTNNAEQWRLFGAEGGAPKGWPRRLFLLPFQAIALEG